MKRSVSVPLEYYNIIDIHEWNILLIDLDRIEVQQTELYFNAFGIKIKQAELC